MVERLQKIIALSGICSRRRAEELISAGRVRVNGQKASLGMSADPERDEITLDGSPLAGAEKMVYIMLNKPKGFLTAMSDDRGRKTVADLVRDCPARVYPVGRLDLYSQGLLLLTNDGDAAFRLTHPSHEVEKEYLATVTGDVYSALPRLNSPMELDGYVVAPPLTRLVSENNGEFVLSVTIHEGRKRQVRLMCAACGLNVRKLERTREGILRLDALPSGKWRFLDKSEIEYIKSR